ncbi:MAG: DUF4384 domain-containing protein, partial [Gemmatimonadaceae bacterium]|nr:DUF4384 domain-containing protein [Gemmatimonadaceae bacterium]
MLSVALLSLILPVVAPAAGPATRADATREPAVRVSLDHRTYEAGDRARVTVRAREDGYLLVLHVDPDGRVRVLFPLDPGDDNFVRGEQEYEIRGRGDREAFSVDASRGSGTVYAAWSRDPFRFDDFVRGDHWDYRVLGDADVSSDPEGGLTRLVERMTSAHFDYDVVTYTVEREVAYRPAPVYYPYPVPYYPPCWWADPWCGGIFYPRPAGLFIGISFGWPYYGYHRPFFYDPFFYRPYFYPRHFYRPVVIAYRPIVIAHGPGVYGIPYRYRGGAASHGPTIGVQYRPRGVLAGGMAAPVSPLYAESRFRRGVETETPYARRRGGDAVRSVPVTAVGGADRGMATGRRAVTRSATVDGVDRPMSRRDGARVGSSGESARGMVPVDRARSVEPRAYEGRRGITPIDGARSDGSRGVDRRSAEPLGRSSRTYDPPSRAEGSRAPMRAEPREAPRRAEPSRAEPRSAPRAQPRAAPRVERSGGGRVSGAARGGG